MERYFPGPAVEEMEVELLGARPLGSSPRGTTTAVNSVGRLKRGPEREIEFVEIHRLQTTQKRRGLQLVVFIL